MSEYIPYIMLVIFVGTPGYLIALAIYSLVKAINNLSQVLIEENIDSSDDWKYHD